MNKINIFIYSLIGIAVLLMAVLGIYKYQQSHQVAPIPQPVVVKQQDVKNISYLIDGKVFQLNNGTISVEVATGSVIKQSVSLFGEPVYGDFNGDGDARDAAILLVSDPGGSGTFYYAVLAIATGTNYVTTNTLLLGDRIAPQTVEVHNGRAVYNYADRNAGEPMITQPSVGKSLYVQYDKTTGQIGEYISDFEGEADPNKMTLGMKKWEWIKTQMSDGTTTVPNKLGVFSITFNDAEKVAITTDCNSMSGEYIAKGSKLIFSKMISTMMYCDGSQEQEFAKAINNVASFLFTSKGELILELKMDSGTMMFK